MWEYKVVTGTYSVDGANVFIENPAGKGTLQQALDHYGSERWELISSHLDGVQREAVFVLKRPRAGAAVPMTGVPGVVPAAPGYAPPAAAASPGPGARSFVDPDGEVVRRRTAGSPPAAPRSALGAPPIAPPAAGSASAAPPSGGRRRSKADLDKLARED